MNLEQQIREEASDLLAFLANVSDDPAIRADFARRCNALLVHIRNGLEQHMPATIDDGSGPTDADLNGSIEHT